MHLPFKFTGQNPVCFSLPSLPAKKHCVLLPFKFTGKNPMCFFPSRFTGQKALCASSLQVYRPNKNCVLLPFKFTDQNKKTGCFFPSRLQAKTMCAFSLQVYRPKPCVLLAFKCTGQNAACFFPSSLQTKELCVLHFHYTCYILPLLILIRHYEKNTQISNICFPETSTSNHYSHWT